MIASLVLPEHTNESGYLPHPPLRRRVENLAFYRINPQSDGTGGVLKVGGLDYTLHAGKRAFLLRRRYRKREGSSSRET